MSERHLSWFAGRTLCLAILCCPASANKQSEASRLLDALSEPAEQIVPEPQPPEPTNVVVVYNWSDYIAENTLADFQKASGIEVQYDVFDSGEALEAKLINGGSGYDVVFPSLEQLGRLLESEALLPLDRRKLINYDNQDAAIRKAIASRDPGNRHALGYLWGTTGIGYDALKIKDRLGPRAPVDSWELVLKPENLERLADCGVWFLDEPHYLIPAAQAYLGARRNGGSEVIKAIQLLRRLRPHIAEFSSFDYINAFESGDACVAVGWSGDIFQAVHRASESGNQNLRYSIPREGTPIWIDLMAIPKDAKHVDNAHRFIDYLLRPAVAAEIANYVRYASANAAALPLIEAQLTADPSIYPEAALKSRLFVPPRLSANSESTLKQKWAAMKNRE